VTVMHLVVVLTEYVAAVHDRKTLASSGFRPGTHSSDALAKMGM